MVELALAEFLGAGDAEQPLGELIHLLAPNPAPARELEGADAKQRAANDEKASDAIDGVVELRAVGGFQSAPFGAREQGAGAFVENDDLVAAAGG